MSATLQDRRRENAQVEVTPVCFYLHWSNVYDTTVIASFVYCLQGLARSNGGHRTQTALRTSAVRLLCLAQQEHSPWVELRSVAYLAWRSLSFLTITAFVTVSARQGDSILTSVLLRS